jgi:hypothetical protein
MHCPGRARAAAVATLGLLLGFVHAAEIVRRSPFDDAMVAWHMATADGQPGGRAQLTAHGSVRLGIPLEGAQREASLSRGGDGQVAGFDGGFLVAGAELREPLRLDGGQMTFCMRVCDASGAWAAPLFARQNTNDDFGKILYPAPLNLDVIGYSQLQRIKEGTGLEFLWRTTPLQERTRPEYFNANGIPSLLQWHTNWESRWMPARKGDFLNGRLRLNAPLDLIGRQGWHDIVMRFNRTKLDLFVDGVILDEEWPHGSLHEFTGPFLIGAGFEQGKLLSGFRGQVDHLALWNRALSDDEVMVLSGGAAAAAARGREILGPRQAVGQYWRPHGYNTSVGDCMAFAHDGVFHIFFLSDRRHGGSKWGLQALPWGHVSTRDFVHWQDHPCPLDITEPWECCLGTGTFAFHNGRYHLIYIKHDRRAWFTDNPNFGDAIFLATSEDGSRFQKAGNPLMVPGWFGENDINPGLHPDRTSGGFILSLCNWKVFASKDLQTFEPRSKITTPEWWPCTSYWEWNGHYYFTSCGQQWTSPRPIEDPAAKWSSSAHPTLNDGIRVSQTAEFKGRHLMAGFTPEPPNTYFGGELLVREVIQNPDGTLGTKWLPEMIPASGPPLAPTFRAVAGQAVSDGGSIRVQSAGGFAAGAFAGVPQNIHITLQVKAKTGTRHFGLGVRGVGDYASACELQFEPARQRAQFAPVADGRMAGEAGNWRAIGGLTCLTESFWLDVIVKDDLVDACIGGRRTMITRNRGRLTGDRIFWFVNQGEVVFEDIQVRPLLDP